MVRRFTNDGPAANQEQVTVNSTHNEAPAIITLTDGRYVVGWKDNFGSSGDVLARIFNADGTPAAQGGTQFLLSTTTQGQQNQLHLGALSDGRFVATWRTEDSGGSTGAGDGSSTGIRARVFLADGTADPTVNGGNDFIVNTTTNNPQQRPNVVGLDDGRFLISFSSGSAAGTTSSDLNVIGRLFNADGTPDGNDFQIKGGGFGGTSIAGHALVLTLDGRVLSLYDEVAAGNDTVVGRFIDFSTSGVITSGDGSDNVLVGTFTADTLNGLGGADSLFGGDGVDFLNGGAGTDTLKGGSGDDTLNGGADNDTMTGGAGANTYVIAPGDDADTVADFDEGTGIDDRLDLTAFTSIHTHADVLALAVQSGADTVINFGGGDVLTLTDVVRNNLADDDFIFASLPSNDPPVVAAPIADQSVTEDTAWSFQFPAGTFTDPNGDTLSYLATLGNDDPLPGWLVFNAATRTFSGTPPLDFVGTLDLKVTASDGALSAADVFVLNVTSASTSGTPGDDSFTAPAGNAAFNGLGGVDTITFGFALTDATVSWSGNQVTIDGPSSHTVITGLERFIFTDGTVENNDANRLVDDLFYYSANHDVWSAQADADFHFDVIGWKEGRDPSAFFDLSIYLSANPDVAASGVNPLTHYDTIGWQQGRVPSLAFDGRAYLDANSDVKAAGIDPLWHYLVSGAEEGRLPIAPTELLAPNGFDFVHYLANSPDVAAAGVDPFWHFQNIGWTEGRNPNAWFDTAGYLATYTDVAAAAVNPLDHYNTHGWHEGRDPSLAFDTASYLSDNPDVAAADINPLVHFLRTGQHEGRTATADGVWGP
jgi:Ca2+-binding RTX toxin-like protein